MSSGSPNISLSTILYTLAGAHIFANRPPFTAESLLRMMFISVMSAPQARSCAVISESSSSEVGGFLKRAEPPPDNRKITVSSLFKPLTKSRAAWVPLKEFPSGTGCPASKHRTFGISPFTCPYFVTHIPACSLSPRIAAAVPAICHAAFPAATRYILPSWKHFPARACATASSGITLRNASFMIMSASFLKSMAHPILTRLIKENCLSLW